MIKKNIVILVFQIILIPLYTKNATAKIINNDTGFSRVKNAITLKYNVTNLKLSDSNKLSTPQYKIANDIDGFCSGSFSHPVGTVVFGYTPGINELAFDFSVSPGTALILGNRVRVAMARAVINSYLINAPYKAHIENLPYSFHGRISRYQRRGKKPSTFTIQPGDNITFVWIVNGTTPRAIAIRAVSCKIPGTPPPPPPPSDCQLLPGGCV